MTGDRVKPAGCVCEGQEPSPFCYPCMAAAATAATAEAAASPVILVHKAIGGITTAGTFRTLVEHLDGLGIPDDAPAEIRTPVHGDRNRVDFAFRRPTTTNTEGK